jgi:transcriptional regulator GlxA family with amidase domain
LTEVFVATLKDVAAAAGEQVGTTHRRVQLRDYMPEDLQQVLGLYREVQGQAASGSAMLWIDLIEHYITRFAEPLQREDRLRAVWDAVQKDLARPWTVERLADLAGISGEHLRRLCQRNLGRSPMQQLAYLRIQHAAHRLATTDEKVEDIAYQVGYQNTFAFSNTFKRMTGFRPSRFQMHKRGRKGSDA